MKDARKEEIERNQKGWAEALKGQPTIGPDGKLVPPPECEPCTIDIKVIYDIQQDSFDVSGNANNPKSIISDFLRTQIGAGVDKNPTNNQAIYTILINLDLSGDIFSVSHDCGNKGLREGILSRYVSK